MLYTPLLPEAASGTLEPRHVVVPLRQMCPHADLVLGHATALDLGARTVAAETIAGPGRRSPTSGSWSRSAPSTGSSRCPGSPSTVAASRTSPTRSRFATTSSSGSRPPPRAGRRRSSASSSSAPATPGSRRSPSSTISRTRRCATTRRCADAPQRWVLVDAAPTILSEIPRRLGDYAGRQLEQARRRDPRRARRSPRTTARRPCSRGGTAVPARTLVWTAGVKASPLLAELGLPLDERGRVLVDATLRVEGLDDVWALGDCAAVPNARTPGQTDPPTCQHALRQARRLAKNLTGDAGAVRLPDARPGRDARPLQGDRRRDGDSRRRVPRLVHRPHATTSTRCRS